MHRLILLSLSLVSMAACAESSPYPEGVTAELIEEGEGIFLKEGFCYTCHGYTGGSGPNFTDEQWWHSDGSYEGIVATIFSGVTAEQSRGGQASVMLPKGGTQMDSTQIRAVAAYVWSLRLPADSSSEESGG